jgi:hypothetical protein
MDVVTINDSQCPCNWRFPDLFDQIRRTAFTKIHTLFTAQNFNFFWQGFMRCPTPYTTLDSKPLIWFTCMSSLCAIVPSQPQTHLCRSLALFYFEWLFSLCLVPNALNAIWVHDNAICLPFFINFSLIFLNHNSCQRNMRTWRHCWKTYYFNTGKHIIPGWTISVTSGHPGQLDYHIRVLQTNWQFVMQ